MLVLVLAVTVFSIGCAGVGKERPYQTPGRSDVSSIPWNSPEGWEQTSIPGIPGYFGTR